MKFFDINGLEKTDLQVIQDTGWIELNIYIKYRKVNGIVYIIGGRTGAEMVSGYNHVGTLPQDLKPISNIYGAVVTIGYSESSNGLFIENNGFMYIHQAVARKVNYAFNISYPV